MVIYIILEYSPRKSVEVKKYLAATPFSIIHRGPHRRKVVKMMS